VSLIDDYLIPFYGLKEGKYDYEFEAGNKFFEFFENSDIHGGDLKIHLQLYRKSGFLELKFKIMGTLKVTCDRCLEDFDHEIDSENELYIRFGNDYEEISDTVIVIPHEETRINVSQYIYEFSVLALPMQKIHPDDDAGSSGCNQEMMEKLNKMTPHETEDEMDPRWDVLKKLKSKN
jgi:uncharacterized metal-binding protein YceD (DUF177 family)